MNIDLDIPSQPKGNLTPQQQAVVDFIAGHLIVEAVAGSGKTYTILQKIKRIVEEYRKRGIAPFKLIALLAYNNKMSKELKMKIAMAGLEAWCEVGTVHSFGNDTLRRRLRTTRPNGLKMRQLADMLLRYHSLDWRLKEPLARVVSLGKDSGVGIINHINIHDNNFNRK